jgi:hypothetical protein
MENVYLPLISGLIGAVIGSLSSILVMLIQSHYQAKRELTNHGIQIAFQDYKTQLEHAKPGTKAQPISLFVHYHTKMIRLAAKGKLTPGALEELDLELKALMEAVDKINKPGSR